MKYFLLSTLLVFTNIYEVCCYIYPLCKRDGGSCVGETENKQADGNVSVLTWILSSLQCGFCYYWPIMGLKNIYDCISSEGWFTEPKSPSFLDNALEWMGLGVSSRTTKTKACITSIYIILAWGFLMTMLTIGIRIAINFYKRNINKLTNKAVSSLLDSNKVS